MDTGTSMPESWAMRTHELEDQLSTIQTEEPTTMVMAARSLELATTVLKDLLTDTAACQLCSSDEILFYKQIKPHFLGQVLYFAQLHRLENLKPAAHTPQLQTYYQNELSNTSGVFDEHRFIHNYLQSGASYLDDRLFFKTADTSVLALWGIHAPIDGAFPVCYDHVVAELNAASLLSQYLLDILSTLGTSEQTSLPKLTWTAAKAHGIELGYALYAAGVFNNGKAQLKDIMECLENAFHIKWGNYPRTMQEILYRKSGRTVFQDDMKNRYLLYIQRIEDKTLG